MGTAALGCPPGAARHLPQPWRLLQFLENNDLAWKDKDSPELADGAGEWVRKLRAKNEVSAGAKDGRQDKERARN